MAWTLEDYRAQISTLAKFPGDMLVMGQRRVYYKRGTFYVERDGVVAKCSSALQAAKVLIDPNPLR